MADETLLRAEDVAARLKLGRAKVYNMMANGELPVVRIGRAVRVPSRQLSMWIAEQLQTPKSDTSPMSGATESES